MYETDGSCPRNYVLGPQLRQAGKTHRDALVEALNDPLALSGMDKEPLPALIPRDGQLCGNEGHVRTASDFSFHVHAVGPEVAEGSRRQIYESGSTTTRPRPRLTI